MVGASCYPAWRIPMTTAPNRYEKQDVKLAIADELKGADIKPLRPH